MSQEELILLLIFTASFFVSISLYSLWIRLDLWAAKRALEHMNHSSFPQREEFMPPGCFNFVVWPLITGTVISFFVLVR